MAPKRSAPPPPVESSEETASGSETDESKEEIVHSPPSATVIPKNTAPLPQKVQQPEASDEEEDDEGEEYEEDDDEEGEEDEEAEDKANHTAPSSVTINPPPPPPIREESDSDKEEEEEADDEAPEPVSAPNREAEGEGRKPPLPPPPPSSEEKKPREPFQRCWSKDDDVRILEAVAAHRRKHGTLPQPEDLEAALAGSLDNGDYGRKELSGKLGSLKRVYFATVSRGDLPSKDIDRRIFDLAKEIWGGGGGGGRPANGASSRDFGEMCRMYPYLAEEMKALERTHPGLFKREFGLIDDGKARALDQKIKKQRVLQMKLELRGREVTKEVTKTLMGLLP